MERQELVSHQLSPSRMVPSPPHRWVPHGLEKSVDPSPLEESRKTPISPTAARPRLGNGASYSTSKTIQKNVLPGSTWGRENIRAVTEKPL